MIVMLCVDKRMGMFFNRRRQSQDCLLREDILAEAVDRRLWMNAYSYQQFAGLGAEKMCIRDRLNMSALGFCKVLFALIDNILLQRYN